SMRVSRASKGSSFTDLGDAKLIGEIVDSKCYLGVMNPGERKVHRDCAARCISGGVPPMFVVRDSQGEIHTMLLASEDGHPLGRDVLPFVAEPVEISGRVFRSGETLVFRINASAARRTGIVRNGSAFPRHADTGKADRLGIRAMHTD